MMFPKTNNYRNRKLLDLAHEVTQCMFQLEVCQGVSPSGCEHAHSNSSKSGKGFGMKSADDQHVASCPACHRFYDANKLPRDKAVEIFNNARTRTFLYYEKMGWLAKVGYVAEEPAKVEW